MDQVGLIHHCTPLVCSLLLHQKAKVFLDSINNSLKNRIKKKIKELETLSKKRGMHLKYSPFWKQRAGDYKIIYEIDKENNRILILFIGHRRNLYDDFSKLF
ncbi:MAG: type II toxin-antitoxin system RelE/ParE family toxin [Euryarchaeota archaeon]|nr:type II toxin-antitoxin system RelE/ParE family toxin [Euryarchaeota archaeon]